MKKKAYVKVVVLMVLLVMIFSSCKPAIEESEYTENPTKTPIDQTEMPITKKPSPIPEENPVTSEEANEDALNITTGFFISAEWGDYLHMDMVDDDGIMHSFFVLKDPGYDIETLKKGQRIEAYWINAEVFLEAPNETIKLNELVKIEIMK